VHGQEHEVTLASATVLLYPLYHPAAALYTPSMLRALEEDFGRIPSLLGRPAPDPAPRRDPFAPAPEPAAPARDEAPLGVAVQLGLF
jgi:DNA polymerase